MENIVQVASKQVTVIAAAQLTDECRQPTMK